MWLIKKVALQERLVYSRDMKEPKDNITVTLWMGEGECDE
jgi:hypothetical protein